MAELDRATLKSFYQTGDKPTEAQFGGLIDSSLNLLEDKAMLGLRDYNSANDYSIGDTVIENNTLYQCSTPTTGTFNPVHWNVVIASQEGAVIYRGTWDADTNVPDLPAVTPNQGDYYVVGVAGSTDLGGITDWQVGDWAIFNGTNWEKVDNTDGVSTAANVSGDGIGLFKTKTGTILEFKKIQTSDGSLIASEDTTQSFLNLMVNFDDTNNTALDRAWSASRISTRLSDKADKVSGATSGNLAGLNGAGNLTDSGFTTADFLPSSTIAADIPFTPFGTISATEVQGAIQEVEDDVVTTNKVLSVHVNDFNNPHQVTNTQVGLGNVTDDQQLSLKRYESAEAQQVNNTTTLTTALTFSFAPAVSGQYLIEWYFEVGKNSSTGQSVIAQITAGTSLIGDIQARFGQNNAFSSYSGFQQLSLTSAAQTYSIQFAKSGGGAPDREALIRRVRMKITKV